MKTSWESDSCCSQYSEDFWNTGGEDPSTNELYVFCFYLFLVLKISRLYLMLKLSGLFVYSFPCVLRKALFFVDL